jgi:hypothetical protein
MKLTTIKRMQGEINRDWFNGDLSNLPIFFKRSNDNHGSYNGVSIKIDRAHKMRNMFSTLLHEMFHQFQSEILECDHIHDGCYLSFQAFILDSIGVDLNDSD